jgi:hypothetical protein
MPDWNQDYRDVDRARSKAERALRQKGDYHISGTNPGFKKRGASFVFKLTVGQRCQLVRIVP